MRPYDPCRAVLREERGDAHLGPRAAAPEEVSEGRGQGRGTAQQDSGMYSVQVRRKILICVS